MHEIFIRRNSLLLGQLALNNNPSFEEFKLVYLRWKIQFDNIIENGDI
jgi:hypothetical protein